MLFVGKYSVMRNSGWVIPFMCRPTVYLSLVPGSLSLVLADHIPWLAVFWITGAFMLVGIGLTLFVREPDSVIPPPAGMRKTIMEPFQEYVGRRGWSSLMLILCFMFFYKLGDNMATALSTPFYLDLGFSMTEIGIVAKQARTLALDYWRSSGWPGDDKDGHQPGALVVRAWFRWLAFWALRC